MMAGMEAAVMSLPKRPRRQQERIDAERVRAVREASGLTQEDFARAVGVSLSSVSKWERGEVPVRRKSWLAICGGLGIAPGWQPGDPVPDDRLTQ